MQQRRRSLFEHRVVDMAFKSVPHDVAHHQRAPADHQRGPLSLEFFHASCPTFPVQLALPKSAIEMRFGWNLLFGNWNKCPVCKEYREFPQGSAAMKGEPGYFGLVFGDYSGGVFVMHNDLPRDRSGERETVIYKTFRRNFFCIEPLRPVLEDISTAWGEPS